VDLIPAGSHVLDLGCGSGELLSALMARKGVRAEGIEIAPECIQACVARGVHNVHQADLEEGLSDYADQSVDYVIMTSTLQVLHRPLALIKDSVRVGRACIVGFPNFAHWRSRVQLGLGGRMPVTGRLPYQWHDTPNIHLTTIRDFRALCASSGLWVLREVGLRTGETTATRVCCAPNLLADYAVFVVAGDG
jgi:methionine biosynthesis protein MetW